MFSLFCLVLIVIAFFAIAFLVLTRLYKKATKQISYVRTGFRGQKVIMNGGALVFPLLHDIIPVNMNTLRLAVSRREDQALITSDRMRVDVVTEFYVRTQPTVESIANAAQTLGEKTMHPQTLKELVEGKFVDALRSVAAEMTMEELHEMRTEFVQKVQKAVSDDLLKNGLELETVSLTALDQTDRSFLNPNNIFDAEGLTKLTEAIEQRKKLRNDIEQNANVAIHAKNMESEKLRLKIARDEEYARLEQGREISIRKATQIAEIAKVQAEQKKSAEQADIESHLAIEQAQIASDRDVAKERIAMDQILKERELEKKKSIELFEQQRSIEVAEAKTKANYALALAAETEEKVITSKEVEAAERSKKIELIEASKQAERIAIEIKIAASSEKAAALDQAFAIRELAQAHADKERIHAEAKAVSFAVEAKGQQALNEAANLLSSEQVSLKTKLSIIANLSAIIRESVKPLENIDGIKIIQVGGLQGFSSQEGSSSQESSSSKNLGDQVVNSALKYRAQAPLLDSLLKEIGLDGSDIHGLTHSLKNNMQNN
jgi:uncharacterized membrane protein YqiK